MHAFFQNAITSDLLYSGFVWTNIQALSIQKPCRTCFVRYGNIENHDYDVLTLIQRLNVEKTLFQSCVPAGCTYRLNVV